VQPIDQAVDGGGCILRGDFGQTGVTGGGGGARVTEQALDVTQTQTLLEQMGGIAVATGIITLLMNRNLVGSSTRIIPTTVSPSTSSGVCDASTTKRIS